MKKKFQFILPCLSILFFLSACQTTEVNVNAEAELIRNLSDQWNDAIRAKDNTTIMNLFSEDVAYLLEHRPIVKGKEAVRELQEEWFAYTTVLHDTQESTIEEIEVSTSGDLAYTRSIQIMDQVTTDGTVKDVSKWVAIWKKIDGEWKVAIVMGNSDNPE